MNADQAPVKRILIGSAALLAALAVFLVMRGMVRTVVEGRLYISPQPRGSQLQRWAGTLGLRSVVNLRGAHPSEEWYKTEERVSRDLGLERLDLNLSSSLPPSRRMLLCFIRRFPSLPTPVLIHCMGGIDRSSLGAFLALTLWNIPFAEAASWIRSPWKHRCVRFCNERKFLASYEAWCANAGVPSSAAALGRFIEKDYCPEAYRYGLELSGVPHAAAPGADVRFRADVTNAGPAPWKLAPGSETGIRLGGRLYGPLPAEPEDMETFFYDHQWDGRDAFRAGLEEGRITVGGKRVWNVRFRAPERAGLYLLAVDMVDEHVTWFCNYGRPPAFVLIHVPSIPPA